MKRIVVDVDNTLTIADSSVSYADVRPNLDVISKLRVYNENGFEIVLSTSRNMRSFNCNTGKINAITLPVLIEWLRAHDVPYDEIWIGKPWCGTEGFYVDDRAIRPNELVELEYDQILNLISASNEKS